MKKIVMFEDLKSENSVNLNFPFVKRNLVLCILKNPFLDKFLVLNWKNGWKSFLGGGIDEGESIENAAIREIKEESGYVNVKFNKVILDNMEYKSFAKHKKENRWAIVTCVEVELLTEEKKEISKDEKEQHEFLWLNKDEINNFLNIVQHKYAWYMYNNLEWKQKENEFVEGVKLSYEYR